MQKMTVKTKLLKYLKEHGIDYKETDSSVIIPNVTSKHLSFFNLIYADWAITDENKIEIPFVNEKVFSINRDEHDVLYDLLRGLSFAERIAHYGVKDMNAHAVQFISKEDALAARFRLIENGLTYDE